MSNNNPKQLFSSARIAALSERASRIAAPDADFLVKLAGETIAERIAVTNREFDQALDLLSPFGGIAPYIEACENVGSVERVDKLAKEDLQIGKLPLQTASFPLIVSLYALHRMNDLPGTLSQIRQSLTPDGLFAACLPGSQTLRELRECLIEAESQLTGSASLRVEPFAEIRQFGDLLQRAGFKLPVVDSETVIVRYGSLKNLVSDLRSMGATSALATRPGKTPGMLFELTEEIYKSRHSDADGKIRVTVETVFLSGWSPHESQQQPLAPGSAKNKLSDFL